MNLSGFAELLQKLSLEKRLSEFSNIKKDMCQAVKPRQHCFGRKSFDLATIPPLRTQRACFGRDDGLGGSRRGRRWSEGGHLKVAATYAEVSVGGEVNIVAEVLDCGVEAGMELDSFVRFRTREGEEEAFAEELREVVTASRAEKGCVQIEAFRGTRDRRLFYIHSRWGSEEVFETHAQLAHTVKFLRRAEELLEQPVEAVRTERIG